MLQRRARRHYLLRRLAAHQRFLLREWKLQKPSPALPISQRSSDLFDLACAFLPMFCLLLNKVESLVRSITFQGKPYKFAEVAKVATVVAVCDRRHPATDRR